jgi:hypothetical protein
VDVQGPPLVKRPLNSSDVFATYAPSGQKARRKRIRRSDPATAAGASEAAEFVDAPDAADAVEAAGAADTAHAADAADAATNSITLPTTMPRANRRRVRRTRNVITGELELPRAPSGEELESEGDGDGDGEDGGRSPAEGSGEEDEEDEEDEDRAADDHEMGSEGRHPDADDDEAAWSLQLLDAASAHPLLAHRGKVYSCHWATTMGTDVFFAPRKDLEPDDDAEDHDGAEDGSIGGSASAGAARAALHGVWTILGTSAARLVAEHTEIEYRSHPSAVAAAEDGMEQQGDGRPFLEKLIELKQQRGEKVPLRQMRMWGPEFRAVAEGPSRLGPGVDNPVAEGTRGVSGAFDSGIGLECDIQGPLAETSGN